MSKKDEKRIDAIKKKFTQAIGVEEENRRLWLDDMRFAHVPGYQWPDSLRRMREDPTSPRPCLEINVLAQHVYQIVNDIKQNRPSVKVRPTGMDASGDVADVYDGVIRHIYACSNADFAIDTAVNHSVTGGWGYFRVVTEYANEGANEQDIYIRPIFNPLSVSLDANSMCPVGTDSKYGFVTDHIARDEFEAEYGEECGAWDEDAEDDGDWVTKDAIRVCEYFEKAQRTKNILTIISGEEMTEDEYWERFQGEIYRPQVVSNKEETEKYVKWTKLTSFKILDEGEFPSEYIPIIRVPGLVVDIDGVRRYKGIVRDAKDPQRVYNYQWSNFVETVALQNKVPYLVAEGQIDGHEAAWNRAHVTNLPYLEYRTNDLDGNQVGPPQRNQLQAAPSGVMQGIALASDAIKMVTGQHDASMGARSNETSGKAIIARQNEGDVATYHFSEGLQGSIRHLGRILIDMIPKVFDTVAVMRILGEDGETKEVKVDPRQREAVKETMMMSGKVEKIYNIGVGKYDVTATAGPSYSTKRQEAVEAMAQIMQGNPAIFPLIGDIWIRNQDWPGSTEISERLKTMLPPQLKDEDGEQPKIPPQVQQQMQQMQQQMQQMQQALQQAGQELQEAKSGNQVKMQVSQQDSQVKMQSMQMEMEQKKQQAIMQAQIDIEIARMQIEAKEQIAQMEMEYKLRIEMLKPQPQQQQTVPVQ